LGRTRLDPIHGTLPAAITLPDGGYYLAIRAQHPGPVGWRSAQPPPPRFWMPSGDGLIARIDPTGKFGGRHQPG
jgi:hypothetical protein